MSDFNVVKSRSERIGVGHYSQGMEHNEFQKIIDDSNLIDLLVTGKRFTWFKPDRSAMSKIDKFLLSKGRINLWRPAA